MFYDNSEGALWTTLYSIVCTFGAAANLFVLFVFFRSANLRNVRNRYTFLILCDDHYGNLIFEQPVSDVFFPDFQPLRLLGSIRTYPVCLSFIMNLACSDLLLCTFTAPISLYISTHLSWSYGTLSCQIVSAFAIYYLWMEQELCFSSLITVLTDSGGASAQHIRILSDSRCYSYWSSAADATSVQMVSVPLITWTSLPDQQEFWNVTPSRKNSSKIQSRFSLVTNIHTFLPLQTVTYG